MVKIKIDCQLTHSKHEGKCYRQDKRTLLTTGKSAKAKDSYIAYKYLGLYPRDTNNTGHV